MCPRGSSRYTEGCHSLAKIILSHLFFFQILTCDVALLNTKDWSYTYEPLGRGAGRVKFNWFSFPWSSWRNRMWTCIQWQYTYFCKRMFYVLRLNWIYIDKLQSFLLPLFHLLLNSNLTMSHPFFCHSIWIWLLLSVTRASGFLTSSVLPPKSEY